VTLDPRARRFLDLLAASGAASAADVGFEARRRGLAEVMRFAGRGPEIRMVCGGSIAGPAGPIGVRIYDDDTRTGNGPHSSNAPERGAPGLIYLHGGGLVAGSLDTHDPIARSLAAGGRCRVVSVDYRLAPEHRFPAAFEDALAVCEHVRIHAADFGIDGQRLGICGDSAGGSLAAAVCGALAARREPPPALQLLICPILDYGRISESRRALSSGYFLDEATLEDDLKCYLAAGIDPDDPRISPLRADRFDELPPTVVHTAEYDPLRDEGRAYADRLAAAGSPIDYTCHPGMIHLFYGLGSVIPHARAAFEQIGAQIQGALAPTAI
jgi:acetyl esterase/lipase